MTVGSLFAGIGGMELGLERAGMEVRWQVEIDPFCRKVLTKHWPDVPKYEDVRDVGAHNLEPVDLICGGFPCQDLSRAGRRAGIDGAKSGLWREYARIVRELRPAFVFVENVPGLLVHGLGSVLGDLAALGYDAEWDCIPASALGAPHIRDRFWLLAYAHREGQPQPQGRVPYVRRWALDSRQAPNVDDAVRGRHGTQEEAIRAGWVTAEFSGWWASEPDVGRMAHGVPSRVDRLAALGNAVVPQVAEYIGRQLLQARTV